MTFLRPVLRPVALFVFLYFLGFVAAAIVTRNYELMMYEAQMAVIMVILYVMDRRVVFSGQVLWLLAIWGFLHLSGGIVPIPDTLADLDDADPLDTVQVLYNMRPVDWLPPRYDQCVHALGFGTCVLVCFEAMKAHFGKALTFNAATGSAVFLMALGLGAVNEIVEFAAVLLIPDTNVGGYLNTGWDLVSNMTGALIAVLYLKFREGKNAS